ncbi:MAG: hypothetical protein V7L14_15160 [Nostoc sp.]|uniref:hypothetical protein n=1 Tax=Nostoc sp. TaxID=1180 RepID=UPI002FFB335E
MSGDALALSGNTLALLGDTLALQGIAKFNLLRINEMLYLADYLAQQIYVLAFKITCNILYRPRQHS